MKLFRPYLGLALCLLLATTGQTMAVARGTPAPVGQMVLCTGSGPVTVLVDQNGQPTGAVHICPDLALTLFAALEQSPLLPTGPTGDNRLHAVEITPEIKALLSPAFQARAPPLTA